MTSEEFIQKISIFDDHETPRFVGPDNEFTILLPMLATKVT
jgi:hypothetical protein